MTAQGFITLLQQKSGDRLLPLLVQLLKVAIENQALFLHFDPLSLLCWLFCSPACYPVGGNGDFSESINCVSYKLSNFVKYSED